MFGRTSSRASKTGPCAATMASKGWSHRKGVRRRWPRHDPAPTRGSKLDARRNLVEVGQAIDQEVAFAAAEHLRTGKDSEWGRLPGEVRELVRLPLIVVLGDHHAVQADRAGARSTSSRN